MENEKDNEEFINNDINLNDNNNDILKYILNQNIMNKKLMIKKLNL